MPDRTGKDSRKSIGGALRGARRSASRRITQEALADQASVSKSMVVQIEGGQRLPSRRMTAKLVQALLDLGAERSRVAEFQYRSGGVAPPADQAPAASPTQVPQHEPAPEPEMDDQPESKPTSATDAPERLGPTEIAFRKLPTGQRALLVSSEVPFAALISLLDMFTDVVRPPVNASLEDVVRITQTAAGNRALVFPAHTPLAVFVRIVEHAYWLLNRKPSSSFESTTEAGQGHTDSPAHAADAPESGDA